MIFLGTGTGHCGTQWFASFMTELGYSCGHEEQYHPLNPIKPLIKPESSLVLVPYLQRMPEETPLVQLVRDPVRVLNSCLRTGVMRVDEKAAHRYPYSAFYYKHLPEAGSKYLQIDRLMTHITKWDSKAEWYQPRMVMRIGDPGDMIADNWSGEKLAEMVRFCTGDEHDPLVLRQTASKLGRVNDHYRTKTDLVTWDSLPSGRLADEMRRRAVQYGFLE